METRALRNARGGKGGAGEGVLTQASGYNFPLFLVCPVDMPVDDLCCCSNAVIKYPESQTMTCVVATMQ